MQHITHRFTLGILLLCLNITSCIGNHSTATPSILPTSIGYPGPSVSLSSAYPPPDSPTASGVSLPNELELNIPREAPEPAANKASISGLIYSFTISRSIPETDFFLMHVTDSSQKLQPIITGPDNSKGDIVARTNAKGQFSVNDIPAGRYVLVVQAPPFNWSVAVASPNDDKPNWIELTANQKRLLGIIYVSWP